MSGIFSGGDKSVRQLQFELGNHTIDKIRIVRKPLNSIIQKLGRLIIPNKQGENPDKYFHLWTEISVVNDKGQREVFAIEKNQRVNIIRKLDGGISEPMEAMNVNLGGKKITVNEFINNGKASHNRAGISWEKYRLHCANCQRFTLLNLRGSGLEGGNKEVIDFTIQPVDLLLPKWSQRIVNFLTDTTAKVADGLDAIRLN